MKLTDEMKRKIAARLFYDDNRDQYEDYHEAAAELLNTNNASDKFIDFACGMVLRPEGGHRIFVRQKDGHVATVRTEDFFFSPRTMFTEDEVEEMEAQFNQLMAEDSDPFDVLRELGWVEVEE